ncbi:hypothetical protein BOTBODRAFT_180248 [Botryobasidium botryosum FD-172 SS1]|uniref:Uncharacterized protein n=1 Tax=Botryobasidium botryosum (strain FD-172 SS1) TaxID=930990 RepID=A0A067LXS2_BOTB1|nr:hypothetical protein BOTBODRAFT_180248 [Botryobasidium botryosum FD-172 SS1]
MPTFLDVFVVPAVVESTSPSEIASAPPETPWITIAEPSQPDRWTLVGAAPLPQKSAPDWAHMFACAQYEAARVRFAREAIAAALLCVSLVCDDTDLVGGQLHPRYAFREMQRIAPSSLTAGRAALHVTFLRRFRAFRLILGPGAKWPFSRPGGLALDGSPLSNLTRFLEECY